MKLVAAAMDESLRERIRRAAYEQRCSMSEVIRRAVLRYLKAQKKGGAPS